MRRITNPAYSFKPTGGRVGKQHFGLGDAGFAGGGFVCAVDDDAEGAAFHPGFAGEIEDRDSRQLQRHRGQGGEGRVLADPAQTCGGIEEEDGFADDYIRADGYIRLVGIGGGPRLDLFGEGEHAPVIGAAEEKFAGAVDGCFHFTRRSFSRDDRSLSNTRFTPSPNAGLTSRMYFTSRSSPPGSTDAA